MAAKKAEIVTWNAEYLGIPVEEIGLNGSPTQVMKIFTPPKPGGGKVFEGEPEETVAQLLAELSAGGIKLGAAAKED
jgi:electron transfer flavoprotein beta subunit